MANNLNTTYPLPDTTTRDDIYTCINTANPTSSIVDGLTLGVDSGKIQADVSVARWFKCTIDVSAAAFTDAATSQSITCATLPAGGIVHGVKIKHTARYNGGGSLTFTLSVGISGNTTKYASAFDVFQATGDTVYQVSDTFFSEDHTNTTAILATATSDVNVNLVTVGDADIWILYSAAV